MLPVPELDFQRTPVTLLIAAVAVAIEVACSLNPERRDVYYMTWKLGILSTIWAGELWRPFTTSLLHGDLIHVAFNVYWLLTFGRVLEPFFGSVRYLLVLVLLSFVSMVPAFLASNFGAALDKQHAVVGLSGVVYGLFGMLWIGRRYRRDFDAVCGPEVVQVMVAWFFIGIVLTYTGFLRISNVAHGMGCGVGVLYGLALFEPTRRRLWQALAVAVTVVLLTPSFAAPGHPLYEKHRQKARIEAHFEQLSEMGGRAEEP